MRTSPRSLARILFGTATLLVVGVIVMFGIASLFGDNDLVVVPLSAVVALVVIVSAIVQHYPKPSIIVMLAVALLWGCWWFAHRDWDRARHKAAVAFCESLVPNLEAYRKAHGEYPASIPEEWLANRQIPDLVRKEDFYLRDDHRDVYLLRFLDASGCVVPVFMCNDVSGLQGGQDAFERGRWLNYDGY